MKVNCRLAEANRMAAKFFCSISRDDSMSPIGVLITFYCRNGSTESAALAAAVGAVQERASIRLRRLPDPPQLATTCEEPEHQEDFDRMRKEYVPPTEADILWADAIVFAAAE